MTFVAQYDNIIMGYKSEVMEMPSRIGRPTDNPKGRPIHIRLDSKSETILQEYTEQEKVSRAEAIRRGIAKLENDLRK